MKLTVIDRLVIPSILPKQGKLIEMMIADTITQMIKFTAEEISLLEFKDTESGTMWNAQKDIGVVFTFTAEQLKCLRDSVNRVDEAGQVNKDALKTCQKILDIR